jgi:hypothetical protein
MTAAPGIRRTVAAVIAVGAGACSNGVPLGPSNAPTTAATSTPAPSPIPAPSPTPGTGTATSAVAYTQDLQPFFATDCVPCHGGRQTAARYSMTTYAAVMTAVRAAGASSPLIIVTESGGLMYAFLTGDRASKAAMIRTWVMNGAPQSR